MSEMLRFFIPIFLLIFISKANGVEKSESDLRRVLFENYDKLVRPVRKTTDSIPVRIDLHPIELRDVDVEDREVKFEAWLYMRWEDAYLTWDVAEYGVNHLVLPVDQIWTPDIAVYTANSHDGFFPEIRTNAVAMNNGTVLWVPPLTIKSRCIPTEVPLAEDTFQCTVKLGSWTYHAGLLNVHDYYEDPLTRAISEHSFHNIHPKWILESMTASSEDKKYACCDDLYSTVNYDMRFRKRRSTDS